MTAIQMFLGPCFEKLSFRKTYMNICMLDKLSKVLTKTWNLKELRPVVML